MLVTDAVALADVRVNDAGYLEAVARTARTGVQSYLGSEVGRPDLATVNVFRDEAEVFSKGSLETFAGIPITIDHPRDAVTADNWKSHAVGEATDGVLRDGEFLKIGIRIKDRQAVDAIKAGKRELSVGYSTELVWEDGKAPDGTPYQARQTSIAANHIAIVAAGRAGPQCRIGDSWAALSTEQKDAPMTLKTVTVDGIPVEVTDQGATVINTLLGRLADSKTAHDVLVVDHNKALATKDADLAKKDAEIDGLKAKVLSDADIDKRVAARSDLIDKAKAVAKDIKTEGLSDADIRKAAVKAALGDAAVLDKAPAYIDARFDILVEDAAKSAGADPFRKTVADGIVSNDVRTATDAAFDKSVTDLNAWRKEA